MITREELDKVLLNSRLVDQMAKQLRCPWHEVADRIEQLVGELDELKANRAKLLAYYENLTRDSLTHLPDIRPSNYKV